MKDKTIRRRGAAGFLPFHFPPLPLDAVVPLSKACTSQPLRWSRTQLVGGSPGTTVRRVKMKKVLAEKEKVMVASLVGASPLLQIPVSSPNDVISTASSDLASF